MKIFLAHSMDDRDLAAAVVAHLRGDGHEISRPDAITVRPGDMPSETSAALRSADVVVAIVSGEGPNVFYELGLAAGAGVPTLVAARPGESLPADLASVPYVQITGDSLRDAQAISRRVKDLEGLSSSKSVEFPSAEAALLAASQDPTVLERLAPRDFEQLVADFLRDRGYEAASTPITRDGSVDLVLRAPEDSQILYIELKKLSRQSRVSVEAVRDFLAVVSQAAPGVIGILVSTTSFTPAATALAVGSSIVLRTLEELLQAKSKRDLVAPLSNRALEVLTIVRAFAKSIGREEQERFRAIYSARLESLTSREFRAVVRKFQEAVDHERTFGAAASAHRGTKFWSALESLDEIIEQIKAAEARTATGRRRRP